MQECDSSGNCNPVFDTSISNFASSGSSIYHSLQSRLEKRFSGGLSFLASYTWSHSIDNASSANLGSSNNSGPRFFRAFPQWERGICDFDVRHRFVLSYLYELPFGNGKRFGGGLRGVADKIVGGWQIAGITTLSTGNWYTITEAMATFPILTGVNGADLVPGQDPEWASLCCRNIFQYLRVPGSAGERPGIGLFRFWQCWTQYRQRPWPSAMGLVHFQDHSDQRENTFRIPDGDLQPSEPCKFPGSLRQFEAAGRRQLRLRYRRGRASADSVWLEILFLNFDDLKSPVLGPGLVDRIRPET